MKTVMTSNITSNSKWAHRIFNRISILGVDGVSAGGLGTDSGAFPRGHLERANTKLLEKIHCNDAL